MKKLFQLFFGKSEVANTDLAEAVFSDAAKDTFYRDQIFRDARMTRRMNSRGGNMPTFKFGVFRIVGHEHAERIASIDDPREKKLLQQVSMAARYLDITIENSQPDSSIEVENLIDRISRWLKYIGDVPDLDRLNEGVEKYIEAAREDLEQ